ncbi:secreted protein [Candidatus Magnetoovum chiemensis]|nr:secreted protein [Candidatus Magnetoovum chiemensis]
MKLINKILRVLLILLMISCLSACGKKTPPRLDDFKYKEAIGDFLRPS